MPVAAAAVRRFRHGGGHDSDSSDSSDRGRGGDGAPVRARAGVPRSGPPPRDGSLSSLEVSTASSSHSSSPTRSALPASLRSAMAAAAAVTTSTTTAAAAAVKHTSHRMKARDSSSSSSSTGVSGNVPPTRLAASEGVVGGGAASPGARQPQPHHVGPESTSGAPPSAVSAASRASCTSSAPPRFAAAEGSFGFKESAAAPAAAEQTSALSPAAADAVRAPALIISSSSSASAAVGGTRTSDTAAPARGPPPLAGSTAAPSTAVAASPTVRVRALQTLPSSSSSSSSDGARPPPAVALPTRAAEEAVAEGSAPGVAPPPPPTAAAALSAVDEGVTGAGRPALSGPGGAVSFSRVGVQGRGSVPASALAAPSRPARRALPSEHTASAAPPPPPPPPPSLVHPVAPPEARLPTSAADGRTAAPRPQRQAPRLPHSTHSAVAVTLIEDDAATHRRRGSSPAAAATHAALEVTVPSPPLPTDARSCSPPHPDGTPSTSAPVAGALSRSAALAAAQRQREAALVIHDDRVPPAERRVRRHTGPVLSAPAAATAASASAPTDPVMACLLRRPRSTGVREESAWSRLECRPVLRVGVARVPSPPCDLSPWCGVPGPEEGGGSTADDLDGGDDVDDARRWLSSASRWGDAADATRRRGHRDPAPQPREAPAAMEARHPIGSVEVQRRRAERQQSCVGAGDAASPVLHIGGRRPAAMAHGTFALPAAAGTVHGRGAAQHTGRYGANATVPGGAGEAGGVDLLNYSGSRSRQRPQQRMH
ncbi:hypothetical protein NESM_000488400 [Novymonas esmeraldas]|uniref:Uncharacterized protein n=1 Tax=Novymonas esmeraldas TaxID=1808958 RepID=A0AAW0EQW2_9TRYP